MAISFGATSTTPVISGQAVSASLEDEIFISLPQYDSVTYQDYSDDKYSVVSDTKNITVSDNQPHLTQESNSQYIPFIMPRYYDNIDLQAKSIEIHYVNANNEDYYVPPVNVEVSEHYIRFGWLVDSNATAIAGKLAFEIRAYGLTPAGTQYLWRTRPNTALTVEQSLSGNGITQPQDYSDWISRFETEMSVIVAQARDYATQASNSASTAASIAESIDAYSKSEIDDMLAGMNSLSNLGAVYENNVLTLYDSSKEPSEAGYTLATVSNIDTLSNLSVILTTNVSTGVSTLSFYDGQTLLQDVTLDITPSNTWQSDFASSINSTTDSKIAIYNTNTVQPALTTLSGDLSTLSSTVGNLPSTLQSDYYTKNQVDSAIATAVENAVDETTVNALINSNTTVTGLRSDLTTTQADVTNLDTRLDTAETAITNLSQNMSAHNVYDIAYDNETNVLSLFENEDPTAQGATPKTSVIITGGGGGGGQSTASTLTITRITPDTITATTDAEAVNIQYNFTSVMQDGDTNSITGTAVWKVGNTAASSVTVATEQDLAQGNKSFNILPYLSVGTKIVTLVLTDSEGSVAREGGLLILLTSMSPVHSMTLWHMILQSHLGIRQMALLRKLSTSSLIILRLKL